MQSEEATALRRKHKMPKKTEKKENVKLNPVIQSEIKEKIDNSKYGEFAFDFWLSQTLVHT